jgi:membrane protein required for colicin V production
LSVIAAFAAVFTVALVIASLFTPLLSSLVQRSALGGIDQGLGFLFGVARGIVLVAVAFFVYATVVSAQDIAMVNDSRSAEIFARVTDRVEEQSPERALGWITAQYEELVGVCAAPA